MTETKFEEYRNLALERIERIKANVQQQKDFIDGEIFELTVKLRVQQGTSNECMDFIEDLDILEEAIKAFQTPSLEFINLVKGIIKRNG